MRNLSGKDKKQTPFELYVLESYELGCQLSLVTHLIKRKGKYNGLLYEIQDGNSELSLTELTGINPKGYGPYKKYCSINSMSLYFLASNYIYNTLKLLEKNIDFNSQNYLCVIQTESVDIILDYFNEWRDQNDKGII